MIIGWIGFALLAMSYVILLTPRLKLFFLVDSIASLILTAHAIIINDLPFIFMNAFITVVLFIKYLKEEKYETSKNKSL